MQVWTRGSILPMLNSSFVEMYSIVLGGQQQFLTPSHNLQQSGLGECHAPKASQPALGEIRG
jgi:hypothetical protein